jgi:hypothetical protein
VRAVDEVVVELHHVPELRAHRSERGFEILEGLHRLAAKVADDLVLAVDPELTGDVDDARRRGDLDDVGIAGRPAQRRRIDETGLAHGSSPLRARSCPCWRRTKRVQAREAIAPGFDAPSS